MTQRRLWPRPPMTVLDLFRKARDPQAHPDRSRLPEPDCRLGFGLTRASGPVG